MSPQSSQPNTPFQTRLHAVALVLLAWFCTIQLAATNNNTAYSMAPNGLVHEFLNVHGKVHSYYLYTPSNYQPQKPTPLILVFHGSSANGQTIMHYTGMNELAEQQGVLVVYPDKVGMFDWDYESGTQSNDLDFVRSLITHLKAERNVDPNRIYVTGYSSGGYMTNILACTMSDEFAAFAPVDASLSKSAAQNCEPQHPVSMLVVNGTDDPVIKWNGDHGFLSVPDTVAFWRSHDRCSGYGNAERMAKRNPDDPTDVVEIPATGCEDDTDVSQVIVEGGGHTWPGSTSSLRIRMFLGKTNEDVQANQLIWNFFQQHSLRQASTISN